MSNFSADKDSNSKGRSQKADAHIYQHDGTKVDGVNSIGLCHWQQKRGHNQDGGIDIHKGSHEQEDDIDHQKKTNAAADIFGNQVGEKVGNARQSHYFACDSREGVQQTDHGSGGAGNGTAAPEGNLDFLFIDNLQNKENKIP